MCPPAGNLDPITHKPFPLQDDSREPPRSFRRQESIVEGRRSSLHTEHGSCAAGKCFRLFVLKDTADFTCQFPVGVIARFCVSCIFFGLLKRLYLAEGKSGSQKLLSAFFGRSQSGFGQGPRSVANHQCQKPIAQAEQQLLQQANQGKIELGKHVGIPVLPFEISS